MKRQINCIKNRIKWIKELLDQLKEIYERTKDEEINGIWCDISFNIGQMEYYVKKLEREVENEKGN